MKRINNIYAHVYDYDNIQLADKKARKCKGSRYGVKKYDENKRVNDLDLYFKLAFNDYHTSSYTTFKIYEPKERIIYRLPYYPDRITHHAVMNIMEPIWTKIFTRDTYSCIKNRGIHAVLKKLKYDLKLYQDGTKYCAKMDIKKFYPSINHDILKSIIRKKIKDKELLQLLDEIIDSADGVPIGNYLSQFFANLYLAYFDHWIKEELKVKYYYRYADDLILLSSSKQQLRNWILAIKLYLSNVLKLSLKDNYQIFPVESRGIDFVGYVVRHNYILVRKSIKLRLFKLINLYKTGKLNRIQLISKLVSYFGWLKYCNSKNLLKKIYRETGIQYSNWNGIKTIISNFKGKLIYVVNVELRSKYYLIQFIYNKQPYEVKSRNMSLLNYLINKFPVLIKIE